MCITFCIITMNRTRWLANVLSSIRQYCPIKYQVKLLVIGEPDTELKELLKGKDIHTLTSRVNLACGGGRRLLLQNITTKFAMTMDDDMYLTKGSIEQALAILEDPNIGAVAFPQTDPQGHLVSPGGRYLVIKHGVISRISARLEPNKKWIEVQDLDGGAMLMKSEMLKDFTWDGRYWGAFDDLDKSLQILRVNKWKQAIVPKARLIHDRSWLEENPEYVNVRLNGMEQRRSYRLFRKKWNLRVDFKTHVLTEVVIPLLTSIRWEWPRTALSRFLDIRSGRQ